MKRDECIEGAGNERTMQTLMRRKTKKVYDSSNVCPSVATCKIRAEGIPVSCQPNVTFLNTSSKSLSTSF